MSYADFKVILASTASISTIIQFLSGILICRKIIIKGTCGDTSCFPFVAGFASCSLWLKYGCLLEDVSLICVNSTGAFLQLMYVLIYLLYSQRKVIIVRQLSAVTLMLACAILYAYHEPDPNLAKYRIGLLCCSFTLLFFFAPFTVLAQVVRTKNADILPFPLIIMTFIVSLQWFVYGVLLHDTFIQIPNAIGCILSSIQLSLFVVYPNSSKTEKWGAKEALSRIL